MRRRLLALVVVLTLMWAATSSAGAPWAVIGTLPIDAPVTALAVVPSDPNAAYVGTAGRGVLYTSDGGRTWSPLGSLPFATVLSVALDSRDASRVLVGTYGGGVYASNDGGKSWAFAGLGARNVVALAVRAEDGLIVAAAGGPWPGLYRSRDGGRTWEASAGRLPDGAYPTAACTVGKTMVVGVRWSQGGYLLYQSEDGLDWRVAGDGFPYDTTEVTSLTCTSGDVWAVSDRGVLHGRPGGTWSMEAALPESQMGSIAFGGGKLYMVTAKGIYLKIAGGWEKQAELSQTGVLAFGGGGSAGYSFMAALRSGTVMRSSEAPTVAAQPTPIPVARGLPTDPVKPPEQLSEDVAYFPETGHTVARGFLAFWKANGGIPIFGYPLTEEFTEDGRTVQYFERARMEYYPEFAGSPNVIQLGQLGREYTKGRYFVNIDFFPSRSDRYFFKETEHSLAGAFLRFWNENGGVRIFGYPVSEEINEEGRTVQYFERARLEYHPETPDREVQVSDLGRRLLIMRGWLQGR